MKKNKWKFGHDRIRVSVPGRHRMSLTEIGKCVEYCHKALASARPTEENDYASNQASGNRIGGLSRIVCSVDRAGATSSGACGWTRRARWRRWTRRHWWAGRHRTKPQHGSDIDRPWRRIIRGAMRLLSWRERAGRKQDEDGCRPHSFRHGSRRSRERMAVRSENF